MFRNPTTDLIVVLVIVLLILGPKRLPGLGQAARARACASSRTSISGRAPRTTRPASRPELTPGQRLRRRTRAAEPHSRPSRESAEVGSERRS